MLAWVYMKILSGKYGTSATRAKTSREQKPESNNDRQPQMVHDFPLDIYKKQITVLLDHNEACKRTIMCMLASTMSRTSGTSVEDDRRTVKDRRSQIGFCPQQNYLIPYLTCMDHLLFFGQLRGLSAEEARDEATKIFKEVDLMEKANIPAHTLSGGMQRRLSLGNAIIGKTKLLVLDEPSSGLDPESRRELWEVLLRLKKTYSILVITHYTEEADVLGDKIAIMGNGEVIAYGTSLCLKREYGNGYTLKLLKGDKNTFPSGRVLDLIRDTIPGAKVKESVDSLMCVVLPHKSQPDFVSVLGELEAHQQEFGIESIGITDTTLEEVFLK
jgi:ATP-binding cassette, subfamily A (ABC1), member 3